MVASAFADGLRHAASDLGSADGEATDMARARARSVQQALLTRIARFYQPALLRYRRELIALVAAQATPEALDAWFAKRARGFALLTTGALWSASEAGYAAGAVDSQGRPLPIYWNLQAGARHCSDCPRIAASSPYPSVMALPAIPSDGTTACSGNCLCTLTIGSPTGRRIAG